MEAKKIFEKKKKFIALVEPTRLIKKCDKPWIIVNGDSGTTNYKNKKGGYSQILAHAVV